MCHSTGPFESIYDDSHRTVGTLVAVARREDGHEPSATVCIGGNNIRIAVLTRKADSLAAHIGDRVTAEVFGRGSMESSRLTYELVDICDHDVVPELVLLGSDGVQFRLPVSLLVARNVSRKVGRLFDLGVKS